MRNWGWVAIGALAVALVLVAILVLSIGGNEGAEAEQPSRTIPQSQETPERTERRNINIAVTGTDGKLGEAIRHPNGWFLRIESMSANADLASLVEDARTLFQELERTKAPIDEVILLVRTDAFKDVYGHPLKDVAIARLRLTGETFRRINWQGFQPENFPRVADELWLHDQLVAQLAALKQQGQPSSGSDQGQGGGSGHSGGGGGGGGG